jgi:hypothetical protein
MPEIQKIPRKSREMAFFFRLPAQFIENILAEQVSCILLTVGDLFSNVTDVLSGILGVPRSVPVRRI